jgi:ribonuclease VapC
MIFVDASAIIAIMTRETDCDSLTAALQSSDRAITSPIALFEAVAALCRKKVLSIKEARSSVETFLALCGIEIVPITPDIGDGALHAFDKFGKGRGHPAQLNMGDCFAYAAAKRHDAALLFTGDDFPATDIAAGT